MYGDTLEVRICPFALSCPYVSLAIKHFICLMTTYDFDSFRCHTNCTASLKFSKGPANNSSQLENRGIARRPRKQSKQTQHFADSQTNNPRCCLASFLFFASFSPHSN